MMTNSNNNNNSYTAKIMHNRRSRASIFSAGTRTIPILKRSPTLSGAGVFLDDGLSTVDYVLAYADCQSEQLERQRQYYIQNLERHGLIVEEDSNQKHEELPIAGRILFLKVHAKWNTLCRVAELLRMNLPLKNAEPLESSDTVDTCLPPGLKKLTNFTVDEVNLIGPEVIRVAAQFTRANSDQFDIEHQDTFFTATQKIRIVYDVLQHAKCDPDNPKRRGLQWLLQKDVFIAAYPPHDGGTDSAHLDIVNYKDWSQRQILRYIWADFKRAFYPQPLHLIKSYFGDKVGYYFAWLGFYTKMLVFPSLVGVFCFLYGIFSLPYSPIQREICDDNKLPGNLTMCPVCRIPNCDHWVMSTSCESAKWNYRFDQPAHIVMAMFTLAWAIIFLKLWRQREEDLINKWSGQEEDVDDTGPRPEYEIKTTAMQISPVTKQEEAYIPRKKLVFYKIQSILSLLVIIMCVVAGLVGLIIVRIVLYGMLKSFGGIWFEMQFDFASLAIHVLTFIVVMTLGYIYEKAARQLTELECPRTENDYLASYVWKVFIFEILNNFSPLFYAAFARGKIINNPSEQSWLQEACDPGGCLNEVVQACGILLLARLLISNAAELGIPLLKSVWNNTRLGFLQKMDNDDSASNRNAPRWQKDFTLNPTDLDGVYMEYLETMVQFGYVVLFVAAFPLAPLICFINNILEIRLDALNFVMAYRRPLPARATGDHIWQRCLSIIVKLGILSNAGFIAFTSEVIPQIVYKYKYSKDISQNGYIEFSLAKFNTTGWKEFNDMYPDISHCYYRNFAKENHKGQLYSTEWSDIMLARLIFFVIFVLTFYFFQWLIDFLVPNVPTSANIRNERSRFLAKKAIVRNQFDHSTKSNNNNNGFKRLFTVGHHDLGKRNSSMSLSSNISKKSIFQMANGETKMVLEEVTPETLL